MKLDGHCGYACSSQHTPPHKSQLRGNALKELVFSQSSKENNTSTDAYVTMHFVAPEGHTIRFTRTIHASYAQENPAYSSQYRINDTTVSMEAYNKKLESYGILVKARNFLVFQVRRCGCCHGDVHMCLYLHWVCHLTGSVFPILYPSPPMFLPPCMHCHRVTLSK